MIGGVVLTVAAILMMILCRRSSALTLKAMGNGGGQKASRNAMTTTGTSTMSYAAGESVDLVKSSVGGGNGSTALLDASLANDSSQEWEAGNEEDSGSLLRKQKPILQQQHQPNFSTAAAGAANPQMVRGHFCFSE